MFVCVCVGDRFGFLLRGWRLSLGGGVERFLVVFRVGFL